MVMYLVKNCASCSPKELGSKKVEMKAPATIDRKVKPLAANRWKSNGPARYGGCTGWRSARRNTHGASAAQMYQTMTDQRT